MNTFCIVLATVVIRLLNLDCGQANDHLHMVSIYNKHSGSGKTFLLCAGTLITNTCVLTTRFCLPSHAYKIRYGDMQTQHNPTYSKILGKKYHMNSHPELITNNRMNKDVVSGSNNIALALVQTVPVHKFARLLAADYKSIIGQKVKFCSFNLHTPWDQGSLGIKHQEKMEKTSYVINLRSIYIRKRKQIRNYLLNLNNTKVQSVGRVRLTDNNATTATATATMTNTHNPIQFNSGILSSCHIKKNLGPYVCVAVKCSDLISNVRQTTLIPDYGTPLLHNDKIFGVSADIEEHTLLFIPISPYLNWIYKFVEDNKEHVQQARSATYLHSSTARYEQTKTRYNKLNNTTAPQSTMLLYADKSIV